MGNLYLKLILLSWIDEGMVYVFGAGLLAYRSAFIRNDLNLVSSLLDPNVLHFLVMVDGII